MQKIAEALSKAQALFESPKKTKKAVYGMYAPLEEIIRATRSGLTKNDLCFYHTQQGSEMVCFLVHKSGESHESRCDLVGPKSDMQKLGAMHTYARRYTLQSVLGIAADDDDDGQSLKPPATKQEKPANHAPGTGNKYKNISDAQVKRLKAISSKAKWQPKDVTDFFKEANGGASIYDMSKDQYNSLCEFIENNPIVQEG